MRTGGIVDMFLTTICEQARRMIIYFIDSCHVETVVLLGNKFSKAKDYVEIGIDAEDYYRIKDVKSNE